MNKFMIAAALSATSFACALPATAQEANLDLRAKLSAQNIQTTLQLGDLTADWYLIKPSIFGPSMEGAMSMYSKMLGGDVTGGAHFTRGQIVSLAGQDFIVSYRLPTRELDMQQMIQMTTPPAPEPLTPETPLTMILLNPRNIITMEYSGAFDLEALMKKQEEEKLAAQASANKTVEQRLAAIHSGLQEYIDNYEALPLMTDAEAARESLRIYVMGSDSFLHPLSGERFEVNPTLSEKNIAHLRGYESSLVTFYEAAPGADGTRAVLFLNGKIRRVPESQWPEVKRVSKIR